MMNSVILSDALKHWRSLLQASSDTPGLDVEILFKYISGYSDTQLIVAADQLIAQDILDRVDVLIDARISGMPVAYLTGSREFYSLPLKVDAHVLIPRPDTECLVEAVMEFCKANGVQRILDMGTGSGAIALALAYYLPGLKVTATDKDAEALSIARQNADILGLDKVRFILSDWFQELGSKQFDVIVSNPPYIDPQDEHLSMGDVRFEPRSALVAEEHGLADLRKIIAGAVSHLKPGGRLFLEHGCDQADAVAGILRASGYEQVETRQDFGGNDRLSSGMMSA